MDPALLRAIYSLSGLFVALVLFTFALFLAVRRVATNRKWSVRIWHFEIRDADIAVAFAALGVMVIVVTRL